MDFDDLIGKTFPFYGVANEDFKLGDRVYRAVEGDDTYSSYLDEIQEIPTHEAGPFFATPIATVRVDKVKYADPSSEHVDGYLLVDVDDSHVWLIIGTDYGDQYYPLFVFEYQPKSPKEETL
jgi:hypothetical protein